MNPTPETQLAVAPEKKAPILATQKGVAFNSMEDMWRFSVAAVNSGQFKDITTPEIALIRLQAGLELGLTPVWSLANIMVTNGRPSVWGDALLGLVLKHPECQDLVETSEGDGDALTAICEVTRKGRLPIKRTFSVSDAKKAGLWGKAGPWTNYPKRMLQMRARAFACRDAFADALRGFGVVEEQDDIPAMKQATVRAVTKVELPE